jgi:acyl-coenzyme A thioesterase PaaI-like protein
MFGSGRFFHRGKPIAFLEGELHDANRRLLATATARLVRVQASDFDG